MIGGVVPNGRFADANGSLYLRSESLPLVVFHLEQKRLMKILTSPRSTNESAGGRELEGAPLTFVATNARVCAVLPLGGFVDDIVKEPARLALACNVILDIPFGYVPQEMLDSISGGVLSPNQQEDRASWAADLREC